MKKTYFKKALSLIMAVVMIMSCFSMLTPDMFMKAEALTANGGSYYVRVYMRVYDGADTTWPTSGFGNTYTVNSSTGKPSGYNSNEYNMAGFTLFHKSINGTGGVSFETKDLESTLLQQTDEYSNIESAVWEDDVLAWKEDKVSGQKYRLFIFEFPNIGFPTELYWLLDEDNPYVLGGDTSLAFSKITVAASSTATEYVLWQGLNGGQSKTDTKYGTINISGTNSSININNVGASKEHDDYSRFETQGGKWEYPYAKDVVWSNTPEAMQCPEVKESTAAGYTISQSVAISSAKDQYGVDLYYPTWSVKGSVCGTTGISVSTTSSASGTTINLNNFANVASDVDTQKGTVTAHWGSSSSSKDFDIIDSHYTAKFNYQSQNDDMVTSTTVTEEREGYHGDTITAPTVPSYYDGDLYREFSGWLPSFNSTITANVEYTAAYNDTKILADYTEVDEAIADANAIKTQYGAEYELKYTSATRSALDSAINAVVRDLGRTQQTTVDGYAKTINDAIAGLKPNTFAVIFLDRLGAILKYDKEAEYKENIAAPAFPEDQKSYFDAENHYTYDGWDSNEYTSVLDDLVIAPVYKVEAHDWEIETVTSTCVQAGTQKYTCKVCGYVKYDGGDQLGDHVWNSDFTVDLEPTCTLPGSKSIHCTLCDARKDETVVPAKGHQWGTVSSLAPATCDRDGIDTRLCDECGVCEHVLVPASGHNYVKTTVAPTCTAKGYDEYVCQNENCGSSYRDNYTDIIDHPYGEWQTVSEAHCGIAGVKKQICSKCGYVNLDSIDALQHKVPDNWTVITTPTCEGTGYQVKKCTTCNVILEEGTIPAKNHNNEIVTTMPGCTQAGTKVTTCLTCGYSTSEVLAPAGHNYDAGVTSQADCTHGGFKVYTCQNANCGYEKYELINGALANGHKFEGGKEEIVDEATCLEDGQKTVQCVNDGCEYKITKVIPKLGHDMKAGTAVDATCTTSGYTPYACENKDCTYTYNVYNADVQAKGHSFKETGRTDATCTVDGSISYECENCKATKTEVLPKLGHKYEKQSETTATCTAPATETYKCANCQDTYIKYVEASLAHDWSGEWTVVKPATDTETGLRIKKCANCDAEKSEVIPTIGAHVYTSEITTAATCTTDGLRTYTCSAHANCSYTEVIPATGHKAKLVYVAATCTSKGSSKVVCATCDTELVEATEIPMLAHTYDEGTATTPATCTGDGVMTYTCTCGHQITEVIPRTGHSLSSQYNPATCETDGSIKTSCAKCSYSTTQDIPAMGHKLTVTVKDATCSEAGSVTEDCSRCDYVHVTDIAIKNHLYNGTVTIVKEATCTENGEKTIKCATCDVVTTVIIPMTGHAWGEYTTTPATCEIDGEKVAECTNKDCGEKDVIIIPKLGHNYGAWEVVKAATNSEDGEWKRVCLNDTDHVETIVIPKGGHDFKNAPTVTKEATCTKEGTAVYKCSVHANCGVTLTVTVPVKQHTYETQYQNANCTVNGYIKTACKDCGHTVADKIIYKTAHEFDGGTTYQATCTTAGYVEFKCIKSDCDYSFKAYSATDDANGHTLVEGTSTATCTGEGLMTLTCSACTYSTTVKVPARGHNYVEDTAAAKDATCAAAATKTFKCSRCTESYTISVGEKTDAHDWNAWTVVESATASSIGYKTRTCDICGKLEVETILATGEHVFKEVSRTDATCTEKGVINYICDTHNDCGKTDKVEIPATGHNYLGAETTAPTCDDEGVMTYTCQNGTCGDSYTEKLPALGHSYGEGKVTPATCKDTGKIEYKCTRTDCNGIYEVELGTNANAHQYATTVVEATCTVPGTVVTKCTLCDKVTTNETLAAKDHYFAGAEVQTKAPTCTADGTKNVKCKFCDITTEVAVPKLGHSFGDWKKTDATNDEDGKWERECTACHKVETLTIPAGGHNLVEDTTKYVAPKCNAKGQKVYKCTNHENCSITITVVLDYAQHDIKLVTEEATCTQTGTISVACENCDKDFGIAAELPVKAHNFKAQTDKAVAPTCTTSGYTPYKCENCNASYNVYDDKKPATGHTFDETITDNVTIVNATCTADGSKTVKCKDCNAKDVIVLPKTGHTYTATEKAATCTEAATKTYTCSCGSKYIEFTSEAKGHTYGDWTEIQAPTDKAYGIKKRVCACGAEEIATVAPIGDHDYVGEVTLEPTCTAKGIKTFTCQNQNHTTCQSYTEEIPALGHSQTLKYTAATCEGEGSTKIVCSVESCKAELASEVIPALGHAWNDGTVTKATCTAEGKIEYACTRENCNATKTTTIPVDGTAHSYKSTTTQPTCTKEGSVVVKCSYEGCSSILVEQTLPKTEHAWGTPEVTDAKCEEYGSKVYTCTADGCGEKKTEVIEKLGHDWNDWVVVPSTNNAPGSVSRTCKRDANHIETVVIPEGGHNLVVSLKTDASCTAPGSVTYDCDEHTGANDCGITLTVTLDKIQHTFTTTKKDATCLADGEVVTACACGETYRTVIPATGHTYNDGDKTDATCTENGKIVYSCINKNCTHKKEVVLEKLQHVYGVLSTTAATCTKSGFVTYKCATCISTYDVIAEDANGHRFTEKLSSTATCTTGGIMTLGCADCEATMTTSVPALGHDYELKSTTNATCAEGATETYKCSRCVAEYTISVSSKTEAHDWNDWVVAEQPTYTSIGYQTRTCKICGKLEVQTLQKSGDHNLVEVKRDEPTCTADGKIYYECNAHTNCGIKDEAVIPKLGHTEELQYKAADCKNAGYANIYCTTCKTNLAEQTISALGHAWGNENITLSDCNTAGKIEYTCTHQGCSETNTVNLPVNLKAHTPKTTVTAATCTQAGSSVTVCEDCGKELVKTDLPKLQHVWGKWEVTTEATNKTEGEMTRKCDSGCTETAKFPAGGHTFGNVPNSTEPATCTQEGTATYKCTAHANCGVEITVTLAVIQHEFETTKTDATCEGKGSVVTKCKHCDTATITTEIPATGHTYDDGEKTSATCTSKGKIVYTCTAANCGETIEITLEKIQHNYVAGNPVDATCTESGYTPYKCATCDSNYVLIDTPAKGHTFDEIVKSTASCASGGKMTLECDCGITMEADVPPLAHVWGEGVVTASPTCETEGEIIFECENCDATITEKLPTVSHKYKTETTQATCTEDGKVVTICEFCKETTTTVLPKKGHTWADAPVADKTVKATCEAEGSETYECVNCGATNVVIIPALGHVYQAGEKVDPTCTTSGYTIYTCKNDASHKYNVYDASRPAVPHEFSAWTVVTTATQNTNGLERRDCNNCDAYEEKVIPAMKHNMVVVSTKDATCTAKGEIVYECQTAHNGVDCDYTLTVETAEIAHTLDTKVTNATCETAGSVVTTCTKCETVNIATSIPKKEHAWNEGEVTTEASCTAAGEMTFTCKYDATHTYTKTIDMKQHIFEAGEKVDATCTSSAYTPYKCKNCDKNYVNIAEASQGHEYVIGASDATCNTAGEVIVTCKKCSERIEIDVPKLEHVWNEGTITLSDCKTQGSVVFTCNRADCNETKTVALPLNPDAHTIVKTVNDATCTTEGSVVTSCSKCGKELTRTELPLVPHQWGVWTVTKASTNNAEGEMTRTCNRGCTETAKIPAGGHDFGNVPNSTEPATCTKEGTATYKCNKHTDCGVEITVKLAKVQHALTTETEDATCKKEGFVKVYCTAEDCDYKPVDVVTGKLAHIFEVIETVDPDCNTSGYKVYKCKNCDESYKQIDADALAHNYEEVANSSTANCTTPGTKTLKCKDCGKEITVTVPALGHTWGEGKVTTDPTCKDKGVITFTCTVCNDTMTEELPTITHELTTTTTDATCTEDGLVVTVCKYCDYRVEKTIAKKGHTWAAEPESTVPAKCEAQGSATYKCVNCTATNTVTIPALGHVYQAGDKVDPTCTTSGYIVYVCKNDESHTYNVYDASKPAKGHSFGEWTVVTKATETTEGLKERKCACGEKETEVIPAMMHNMVEVENVASTCTKSGHITYKCDTKHNGVACTYTLTVTLPMIAHTLSTDVEAATCEKAGKVVTTCTECNTVNIESSIPAMGHAWDEGKVTTEASCTAAGEITFTCQHDANHTYKKTIEMKQHIFKTGEEVDATCTENAYIPYKCENCAESYVIITGDAIGHKYLIGESTATCEVAGTITITCENSGCKEVIIIAVNALGHDWVTGTITAPTCSTEGTIEYTCSRCDGQKTDRLGKVDHDYATVTNQASCTEDGSVVSTCKYCGKVITTVIPAKGHTWADTPESKVDPKCEEKGSATYKCVNCDERKTVEIPALGHVYEAKETVAPTCTTSGYTVYVCKNDASHKYNVYDASKPAVPHEFSAWTVVTNATQDTDGLERRECNNCDAYEEKVIPAMKHNMVVKSTKDATCIADGEIVYECQTAHDGVVCNYTLTVTTSKIAHTLKTDVEAATCEEAGKVVTSCEKCNTVNKTTVLPALGHKYVGAVTTPAGCETDGVMTYTCQNDAKHTYTEVIPAKGHSYTPELTAPTCTAEGYTTYKCACGHSYVDDEVAALGHNFGSWTDTGSDDVHTRFCSRCSATETEAHRWDNGKVLVEPTYDTAGKTLYTCGICGATKIEGMETNVDNNAPTGEIKWNATLWNDFLSIITFGTYVNYDVVLEITAKDGETGIKSIEYYISDKALTLDEVKALTDWTAYDSTNKLTVPAVDASKFAVYAKLTDNKGNVTYLSTDGIVFDTAAPVLSIKADKGNAETDVYCSNVTIEIDDANISHAIYDGKTIGLTTDKFFCNEVGTHTVTVFDKAGNSTEISFTINNGHTWTEAPLGDNSNLKSAATCDDKAVYYAACPVCGEIDKNTTFEYGDALGHDYVGTVTTPATCENDGVRTYTCQNDGSHTYTEVIPATGHTENAAVKENTVEAKCEKDGSYDMVVYCGVCGKELSRTSHVIPATGHSYEGTVTKAPTCTESGVMTYVCANDYTHAYSERISALGHTDENYDCTCEVCGEKCCKHSDLYVKTYDPTCAVNGKAVLKCKNCDREEVTVIPALGHKEVVTYVDATCNEFAHKIIKCANCDELNEKVYTDNAYAKHSVVIIPGKPATCVTDGYTAYERCVTCGKVTEAHTLYKEDVPHVDEDGNGKCDTCGGQFFTDTKTCNCLCHGTGIKGFLYKIAVFFWKIFKMNKSCVCGNVHY